MEKTELTADEIKVIKQQLNGEIEVWNADDYQQKHLTSVIDKANALLDVYKRQEVEFDHYLSNGDVLLQLVSPGACLLYTSAVCYD